MAETIRWWFVLQVVAIVSLPLCLSLFRGLPDRGYALSKPFGLLFAGYAFWLLNSLHAVPNSRGGIVFALAVLAAISAGFAGWRRDELRGWARDAWRYALAVEALLLVVFVSAVWLRSLVGNISGTEQPMDLMFVNAATRADHFPPQDPWLSGHTVAYYYFGYLLVAMTGKLAGVPPEIGYNIGIATIATLALVGASGLAYNLVRMREDALAEEDASMPEPARMPVEAPAPEPVAAVPARERGAVALTAPRPAIFGLLAGAMLVLMGNLVGVLHLMSAWGIGGKGFYDWIDVQGLTADWPRHAWYPTQFFGFFNASRIYPLDNHDGRVITEFPMFSFILGDLHPHVMALPFVLLAVGVALTLYRSREPLDVAFWLQRPLALVAAAIVLGGLAFLNTWDIATFAFVIVGAALVSNFRRTRALTADWVVQAVSFAVPLVLLAVIAYIPFYAGFTSQANGIGAVVSNDAVTVPATRPLHAFLYWGPLLAITLPFVFARIAAQRARLTRPMVALACVPSLLVLLGWLLLFGWQKATDSGKLAGAGGLGSQIADRGSAWLTDAFLGAMLGAALLALWLELTADDGRGEREPVVFALGLTATALLLVLGTEFFYVGDVFNSRMNTVFKLYYQAWLLLAVAGALALSVLYGRWRASFPGALNYRMAWGGLAALALVAGMLYPLEGGFNRTHDAQGKRLHQGLDGIAYFPADERKAIDFLTSLAQGQDLVIAEAVGGDYTGAARISETTGIPAVLGWGGHEDQWRGGTAKARAGRFEDVTELYKTADMQRVDAIVRKYGIDYIYVGPLERSTYGDAALAKFQSLPVAFREGTVTIYRTATSTTGEVQPSP
ncbi:MAG TPA: DUF2298 domain-containing protein [Dehalococcoidia bacterium]|nr:DUF2298 domain-containing protein [Dehalococcoidia bacterium]